MTRLILIRHALTDAVGRVIAGSQPGWPLNETGLRQCYWLSERLASCPLEMLYSSPLERTLQTASAIAKRNNLEPRVDPDLTEVQFGKWEGKTFHELHDDSGWLDFNRRRSSSRAPGGESLLEVQARMMRAVDDILAVHVKGCVGIVSHGDPIRAAIAAVLGIPLDLMDRFEISPASMTIIDYADGAFTVRCLNQVETTP